VERHGEGVPLAHAVDVYAAAKLVPEGKHKKGSLKNYHNLTFHCKKFNSKKGLFKSGFKFRDFAGI
jgi:hypothetical protein